MNDDELRQDLQALYEKYNIPGASREQLMVAVILATVAGLTFDSQKLHSVFLLMCEVSRAAVDKHRQRQQRIVAMSN